jgi:hypothetical protein
MSEVSACPPWPTAGPSVAAELEGLPWERMPATADWLGRLDKLHDQLATCGRPE